MNAGGSADLGPLQVRFSVSADDQRSVARVRLVSAGVSAVGAMLLLLADVPIAVFLAALLALLMSLVWFGQARTARRVADNVERYHLSVYRDGFEVSEGGTLERVRFGEVRGIVIDEERLDIVVTRAVQKPLRIEPRYPGVAIDALVRTLHDAWKASQGAASEAPR